MIVKDSDQLIHIGGLEVPYILAKGRRGRVKLSFSDDGELLIHTGSGELGNFEMQFLNEKAKWISKHYPSIARQANRKDNFLANINHEIELFGSPVPLEYIVEGKTRFKVHDPLKFSIFAPQNHIRDRKKLLLYYSLRAYAEQYLKRKTAYWGKFCEVNFNHVRVKDHKTKWGSCSSLRNINLNWHLIFLEDAGRGS